VSVPAGTFGLTEPYGHGRGYRQVLPVASPAAGGGLTVNLEPQYVQRLLALTFTLTTDATVANRVVTVDYFSGQATAFTSSGAAVAQTASTVQRYVGSWQRTESEWNPGTAVFFPLEDLFLDGGEQVGITITNVGAADQLSAIVATFERFETGPRGVLLGRADVDLSAVGS
jgi:hypothetical protein